MHCTTVGRLPQQPAKEGTVGNADQGMHVQQRVLEADPRFSGVSDMMLVQPKAPKVKCPHCLEDINKGATRCKWCTSQLDAESVLPTPNMGKEVPAKTSKKDQV